MSTSATSIQRLDVEHVYADLKAAIGENWTGYKAAVNLFLLGRLNQNEFSGRVDDFFSEDVRIKHLHNRFIFTIIGNLTRDLPDHGVARWVSTNDKLTTVSKSASGDATERRLKTEVMQLQSKDRRRIKGFSEPEPGLVIDPVEEYNEVKQIRLPTQVPASAGGLNKTNWELEIRKRYSQPLASEIGEFPDSASIYARMIPICYEESVVNGATMPCASYMAIATENFVKDFLSVVFARNRSNGPSGTINGTMTRKYRLQLEREEMSFTRGELVKNAANGLLPIETKEASSREGLGVQDMRLALELGGGLLGHMPLLVNQIMDGYVKEEFDAERSEYAEVIKSNNHNFGLMETQDWWNGEIADHENLDQLLDECLST